MITLMFNVKNDKKLCWKIFIWTYHSSKWMSTLTTFSILKYLE